MTATIDIEVLKVLARQFDLAIAQGRISPGTANSEVAQAAQDAIAEAYKAYREGVR